MSLKSFFSDTKNEIKKVTWPTRQTVIQSTIVVLTVVVVMTIMTALLDISFGNMFDVLNNKF